MGGNIMIKFVNWYDEELDKFYNDDNKGYIYGLYYYEDEENFPIDVEWFKTESDRVNTYRQVY
jgi:hypothetical protein